jgi:group I intron endonuclease
MTNTTDIDEKNGVVYACYNIVNGKVYVGQSWDFEKRIKGHKKDSKRVNGRCCKKFYNAIKKYGWKNFEFIILIDNIETQEDLDSWEIYFIKFLDSVKTGYNIRDGGSHGKLSDETKQKIKEKEERINYVY